MIRVKTETGWLIVSGNSPEIAAMKYGGAVSDWSELPTTGLKNGLVYNNITDHTSRVFNEKTGNWDDLGSTTITVDDALSKTSTNPVQNKVVTAAIDGLDKVSVSATGTSTDKVKYISIGSKEYLMGVDVDDALESGSVNPVQNKIITNELKKKINTTGGIKTLVKLSKAEYEALTTKDPDAAYYVYDDSSKSNMLQLMYDTIYPVNKAIKPQFTSEDNPNDMIPTGVTATWTDISSTYDGRYFKVDNTNAAGTTQNAMLPKHYHSQISDGTWNLARGGAGGTVGVAQAEGGAVYGDLMRTGDAIVSTSPNVDGGLELRPLTSTIKIWKRTA